MYRRAPGRKLIEEAESKTMTEHPWAIEHDFDTDDDPAVAHQDDHDPFVADPVGDDPAVADPVDDAPTVADPVDDDPDVADQRKQRKGIMKPRPKAT